MVGMPFSLLLNDFGEHVRRAFGHVPYHVGSSLTQKDGWRDVDVRLMLPDVVYREMGLGDPRYHHQSKRWVSLVMAWSAFGKHLTGLPIDFQIQQTSLANEKEKGSRSALYRICDFQSTKVAPETLVARCLCSMDLEDLEGTGRNAAARRILISVVLYLTDEDAYGESRRIKGSSVSLNWWESLG
jgi:hypothetical protein